MPPLHYLRLACIFELFLACASAQVDVAIAASKTVYVAGEPVFIGAKITNTSTAVLTMVVPPSDSCLSDPVARVAIYRKWSAWWSAHNDDAHIYAPDDCGVITELP
jgi:hypothetical protein